MAFNWFKKKGQPSRKETAPTSTVSDATHKDDEREEVSSSPPDPQFSNASSGLPTEALVQSDISDTQDGKDRNDQVEHSEKTRSHKFLGRLKLGLRKTRDILTTDIEEIFNGKDGLDEEMLEELEELLITSDIGVATVMELMAKIEKRASQIKGPKELRRIIKAEIVSLFDNLSSAPERANAKPHVVMVIGVNGVGKTTTIGKLAAKASNSGQKVLIAAADTFRAAAIEQLSVWAERSGADIVKHKANADPAAVVYDSLEAAVAREIDTVFIDTAGRLHTKVNLMEELKKIQRTMTKKIADAPHEVLLVVDATTGQNALSQAKLFNEAIGITGLALTKLDGTAKGGIVVSICTTLNLPLRYIGVGEKIEDLQTFDPHQFVEALL